MSPDALVLATVDPVLAGRARSVLEAAGIPCRVEGGHSEGPADWLFSTAPNLLRGVYVPAVAHEAARAALAEAWGGLEPPTGD